ncbi:hypothetical protein OG500_18805 [Kitasatospora sp. NBC_01250]|uniref:hypothetical protein n=1 Tax=unclassified Kitasatospora TaxID=2633591 RepID=UPI002E159197|nr:MULTISPECIES: hypothetical protein [unclassified Kitasatospora]WSJ68188.1 hypothetical protein OG294_19835 [Kitasatospora sp. NBC_01302]
MSTFRNAKIYATGILAALILVCAPMVIGGASASAGTVAGGQATAPAPSTSASPDDLTWGP